MNKKPIGFVSSALVAVSLSACGAADAVATDSGYDEGYAEGYAQGLVDGEETARGDVEAHDDVRVEADKYTGVVPDFVGQNMAQAAYWTGAMFAVPIGNAGVYLRVVSSDGAFITDENAADYRIVSQDPLPGTVFAVTYLLDSNGEEYDNLVDSQGIEEVVVNVEPIGQ
ncbi:MAG: hypothetical protein WAS54_04550 [Scrofimicrobium sp.]